MSYDYQKMKPQLFTDEGQRLFLSIRDRVGKLTAEAGACRFQEIMRGKSGGIWLMLASVDRMIELKELLELTGPEVTGQHRVFVSARYE